VSLRKKRVCVICPLSQNKKVSERLYNQERGRRRRRRERGGGERKILK
jgi:hypothetical protein